MKGEGKKSPKICPRCLWMLSLANSIIMEGVDISNKSNDILFSLMLCCCWSIPNQGTIQLRNCTDPLDTRTYNFLSFLNWYIQSMLCNQSQPKICSNKKSRYLSISKIMLHIIIYHTNTFVIAICWLLKYLLVSSYIL